VDNWRASASCAGLDVDIFFPLKGAQVHPMVRKMCRECPVKAECLNFVLTYPDALQGYWAGTNERRRRALRKKLKVQ
jgi:WhiB family redox-sensing transcriptional regulator